MRLPSLAALERVRVVGVGSFGTVSLVRQREEGKSILFALKSVVHRSAATRQLLSRERHNMSLMDSKFIVRLLGTYRDRQRTSFLLEPALGGDLLELLDNNPKQLIGNLAFVRFIAAAASIALQHIHDHGVIFRDVKPENVVLDSHGYPKLCDFGISTVCSHRTYTRCGTSEYMAPEIFSGAGYDKMVDWWALGVMIYQLTAGDLPFSEGSDGLNGIIKQIKMGIEEACFPRKLFSEQVENLVCQLCVNCPTQRLGCKAGLEDLQCHRFFVNFDWKSFATGTMSAPFVPHTNPHEDCTAWCIG